MEPELLKDLDEIDKQIIKLKWSNRKLSYKQIGQLLTKPITLQSVHERFKKSKVQDIWNLLEKDIIWQIKNAQNLAMHVILRTLKSKDEKLALSAARTILQPILDNCPDLLPDRVEGEIGLDFYETEQESET